MSVLVFFVCLVAVVFWFARRRRRAARLAGLSAVAPVFSVEPPHRRHSKLKGERL